VKTKYRQSLHAIALLSIGLSLPLFAQEHTVADSGTVDKSTTDQAYPSKPPYSPYVGRNFPTRPLFGDTHLHTAMSFDAGMFGARLGPVEAYRFARGEEVTSSSGQRVRLSRPLDFLVVADHSDFMGLAPDFLGGKPEVLADPTARRWYDLVREGNPGAAFAELLPLYGAGKMPETMQYLPGTPGYRSAWQATIQAAEQANEPGRFTAFIGYEWTSNTGGNNLHRNVIYRDDSSKASQMEPYTTFPPLGSDDPRELWKWMEGYEEKTGGRLLAISHNGNLSNGLMFPIIEPVSGRPIDKEYALTRMKWERLHEVTQTKGDSETHPVLSPNDEFANFNRWDRSNLDGSVPKKPEMLEFEYSRAAFKNGLKLEAELGANPYKFGLVGSTDSHNGLTAVEEDNFFGKMATAEPNPQRWEHPFIQNAKSGVTIMGWETQAAGYAAVWAQENTRESIFDAMQRRETYATTGPRMAVRLFGGWDFEAKDAESRSPALIGYSKGVPMGGDLKTAPAGKAPTFLVAALRDPMGANLDRYQIVKGWLDEQGELHERIYDVAVSGGREINAEGRCEVPVGNTVDVENATWSNTIGASELVAVWTDPDFNASQPSFYYGRVIEIPTPRWTAYDAQRFNITMSEEVPMTTTERAYTSPIWYTP
jgi:curved DNA-binding protein CbpA